jgi:hypothetical protein
MTPVVVVTVHNRYWELEENLEAGRLLFHEFSEPPVVVVVWACPEIGRLSLFRRLRAEGKVDHVLTRERLPGETGGASTYPESHNIRLALEFARANYPDAYAVVQAADVRPRAGGYAYIDREVVTEGASAVVFNWASASVPDGAWHTNFFAVRLDERLWPPVCGLDEQDVLEWAWGKRLRNLSGIPICRSHNARDRFFSHLHRSEHLPPYPVTPERESAPLPLAVTGWLPWWRRAWWRLVGRRCIDRVD